MNLLDEILTWFFSETITTLIAYAFPLIAIGLGIYFLFSGEYYWGSIWLAGGLVLGAMFYRRSSVQGGL